MTNLDIKNVLISKGVTKLYHANTVGTSCTYFENGGLLSRGAVEIMGLYQTPQYSDQTDKEHDIYFDLFFDSVDIHNRSKNVNYYGPVMFEFSIDMLDSICENSIKITKTNPVNWLPNMDFSDKYYSTKLELHSCFYKGDFGKHITINQGLKPLDFNFLERVVLDRPPSEFNVYFDTAYNTIRQFVETNKYGCSLEIRECPSTCKCCNYYSISNIHKCFAIGG